MLLPLAPGEPTRPSSGSPGVSSTTVGSVLIRELRDDDHTAVGLLTVAAYDALGLPLGAYRDELADVAARVPHSVILVAEDGGGVVGSVALVLDHLSPLSEATDAGTATVRMLAVDPRAQGRGVADALMRELIARCRAAGKHTVTLVTTNYMQVAQRLYRRLGFVHLPERDRHPSPRVSVHVFELRLEEE